MSTLFTSLYRVYIIASIVQIFEVYIAPSITPIVKTRVDVAFHLMKQVQVVHELVVCTASTTLQERKQGRTRLGWRQFVIYFSTNLCLIVHLQLSATHLNQELK